MPDEGKDWIGLAARAGYASRGVVYGIVGLLALFDGVRSAGKPDAKDAISVLLDQPFGLALVALLFLGLCCYVAWRLVQVALDPDHHGHSLKGLVIRVALLVSAVSYGYLGLYALSLLGAAFASDGGDATGFRDFVAGLIGARTTALVLALMFAGTAIAHWWKALGGTYEKYFKANDRVMGIIRPIVIIGLGARGLVFAVVAWLLSMRFLAFESEHANENPGLQDVLDYISDLPYGAYLISAMGIGLLAFALYSFAEARWRRIGNITASTA